MPDEPIADESILTFVVELGGERLDKAIAEQVPDLSRAMAQRLIKSGAVTVAGQSTKPSYLVQEGDEISVCILAEAPAPVLPAPSP